MALVKIKNEGRSIDFNDLEYLNYTNGWNGGQWNNWDVVKTLIIMKYSLLMVHQSLE